MVSETETRNDEPLPRPARRDALPEHTTYPDTGCDVCASCLRCPLERCRYEEPGGLRRLIGAQRDRSMLEVQRQERLTANALARRFGVSRRTVFRVLAKARRNGNNGGGAR